MPKKKPTHDLPPHGIMTCIPVQLDLGIRYDAAMRAIEINPQNAPSNHTSLEKGMIGVLTSKYWGDRVRDITVGFMEQTTQAMRDKVLAYANRWSEFTKAKFRWSKTNPMVRISFGPGGYYSYLGTDILSIPPNELTMNLERFTVNTPDSEWERVVVHEFGHTLGCPHEHSRQEIIALLDRNKVIAQFQRTQGWSQEEIIQQILTPVEERSLMGASPQADTQSIMCYQFDGSVTKSGKPILGGNTVSATDKLYMSKIYPPDQIPPIDKPPITPPTGVGPVVTVVGLDASGKEVFRFK